MVPERTRRAAGLPARSATNVSRELVVGSSTKTSSRRVVAAIALSMDVVGVVTTSERKSNAAGPAEDHAFVAGVLDVDIFSAVDSIEDLERDEEAVLPFVVAMADVVWNERYIAGVV